MFCNLPLEGKKTVCVVSGGNIDVTTLNRIINRGLQKGGRLCTFSIEIDDKPGQLVKISSLIASLGANIISVLHERTNTFINVNSCVLRVSMETRDQYHIDAIRNALLTEGIQILGEM